MIGWKINEVIGIGKEKGISPKIKLLYYLFLNINSEYWNKESSQIYYTMNSINYMNNSSICLFPSPNDIIEILIKQIVRGK
jgi:hypothetical protein